MSVTLFLAQVPVPTASIPTASIYGEKQELYRIFAELLSVEGILKKGRGKSRRALYRWVCNSDHSNIGIFPQTLERGVSEQLRLHFNRN